MNRVHLNGNMGTQLKCASLTGSIVAFSPKNNGAVVRAGLTLMRRSVQSEHLRSRRSSDCVRKLKRGAAACAVPASLTAARRSTSAPQLGMLLSKVSSHATSAGWTSTLHGTSRLPLESQIHRRCTEDTPEMQHAPEVQQLIRRQESRRGVPPWSCKESQLGGQV